MVDENDADDPLDPEDEEIAAEIAGDTEALLATLPHYYRGEVSQATGAQDRIDRTTNWAITVLVALLSIVFSSPDMPAYLLLIGIVALGQGNGARGAVPAPLSDLRATVRGVRRGVGGESDAVHAGNPMDGSRELPGVPGSIVAGGLAAFYLGMFVLAGWPGKRQAKGEIYGEEPGAWKNDR